MANKEYNMIFEKERFINAEHPDKLSNKWNFWING